MSDSISWTLCTFARSTPIITFFYSIILIQLYDCSLLIQGCKMFQQKIRPTTNWKWKWVFFLFYFNSTLLAYTILMSEFVYFICMWKLYIIRWEKPHTHTVVNSSSSKFTYFIHRYAFSRHRLYSMGEFSVPQFKYCGCFYFLPIL